MNDYHNKYLNEYKKRMDPKYRWRRYMSKEEKVKFYSGPIIAGILLASMFIGAYFILKKREWILIGSVSEIVALGVMYVVLIINEKFTDKVKERIAREVYKIDSWEKKNDLDRKVFKEYLRMHDVKTEKQISMVLESIEKEIIKKSKSNIVIKGGAVVFLLPVWAEQVKVIYKDITISDGFSMLMFLFFVVGVGTIIWKLLEWCIKKFYQLICEIKEWELIRSKELRGILLEMYLEALGKE
ncbi:hypothetical protein [Zhenhengia yiwuensis]|uniref:Uncharacterized protein n=1 Tax=Zhenhengia yiwuensis TaxID=2763666 RepID=A0A926IFD7_9FIRM|nr:hypothetical protein [Zhenhengia yiwuensis]MBC8580929.1 hypothetical protein [Zhenhengia yiwuensis]